MNEDASTYEVPDYILSRLQPTISVGFPKRAAGLEEFVAELLAFPGGHDDQVDALAQGLAWGRQSWSRRIRTYAVKGLY